MALHDIIVIGASAGGAEALRQILRDLPADFSATIFVVTHLPSGVRSVLPRLLSAASRLLIAEAAHGASVEKGRIYVAPSGAHLLIGPDGIRLGHGPCVGMAVAFAGLATIGLTVGGDLTPLALGLALAGAFSWAVGNVLVKRHAEVPIFPLVVWCSLVPPLPWLLISSVYDSRSLVTAVSGASWLSLAATLYLGTLTTIFGYAVWGRLLQRYPAALVAPFALLSPCTGIVASAALLGEVFTPLRYAGMALILAGVVVVVLPGAVIAKPSARR